MAARVERKSGKRMILEARSVSKIKGLGRCGCRKKKRKVLGRGGGPRKIQEESKSNEEDEED